MVAIGQRQNMARETESGPANLVRQGLILAGRNVRLLANFGSVVMLLIFPLIFLYGFLAVFGTLMDGRGINYPQYLTPAIIVHWMFNIADTTGFWFATDRRTGMLSRFRSMPINRGAVVLGRLCADALRAAISMGVILTAGYLAGFRFHAGPVAAIGFALLAIALSMTFAAGTSVLGLASTDPEGVVATVSFPHLLLIMISTAFVPADAFPSWLQPVVENSPVSVVLEAMRTLAGGGAVLPVLWPALIWLAGLLAVFSYLATRAFRRAS